MNRHSKSSWISFGWALTAALCMGAALAAQTEAAPAPQKQKHITPEETRRLFSLVDELTRFSSEETGLAIRSEVKRKITSRAEVESYLKQKFEEDESAKRLQQGEIVLKKFGLLDRDFALKPFMLALLGEQIEAYYDSKTKTVTMLDWVDVDEQKPVLAHELTHALQDQRVDLEKWNDQTPLGVSLNSGEDKDHLVRDEMDTAREAVAEGQATAVMMDYRLKPAGKTLINDPEILDAIKQQMTANEDSPVLARAPLLLSESLLFPYREGLSFEQDIWMDQGQKAAFAGTLDRPPTSSWEILNPLEYEKRHLPALPLLPDFHPITGALYKPYDIGQIGQLDLRILAKILGGDGAANDLTPAWNGGIYWAGQLLSAKTAPEKASTKSIAIFYLSVWKNAPSAQAFAGLYADELGRKYSGLKRDEAAERMALDSVAANAPAPIAEEQVYSTDEGPVVITIRGKLVFVAESFPLEMARKLSSLILDAQGTGEMRMAASPKAGAPSIHPLSGAWVADHEAQSAPSPKPLTGSLIRFFSESGVIKAVVDAEMRAAAIAK